MRIKIDEDETLPGFNADRQQAIIRTIKVFHALEFGHAFQRSVKAVFPSVIGTLQDGSVSARLSDYSGRMMAANVEEGAKDSIRAADYNDRLAGDARGDELSGLLDLLRARDQLPGFAEDIQALKFGDARIDIP